MASSSSSKRLHDVAEADKENIDPSFNKRQRASTLTPSDFAPAPAPAPAAPAAAVSSSRPVVISLDGNIGAGKSTFLEALRASLPDVCCIVEPVGEWLAIQNAEGQSLLSLFYADKRRWSYTFQLTALLTRLKMINEAMASTKHKVIITERSVLTDRFVFAEMLRDAGDIDSLEWDLYCRWFDEFATKLPHVGVILLSTSVDTSASRICTRGRAGEDGIPIDYLAALDQQHKKWVDTTPLATLSLSTEPGIDLQENIDKVRAFVDGILEIHHPASVNVQVDGGAGAGAGAGASAVAIRPALASLLDSDSVTAANNAPPAHAHDAASLKCPLTVAAATTTSSDVDSLSLSSLAATKHLHHRDQSALSSVAKTINFVNTCTPSANVGQEV